MDKRTCYGGALRLASRDLVEPPAGDVGYPQRSHQVAGGTASCSASLARQPQWQLDVLDEGELGHEVAELEHEAHPPQPQVGASALAEGVDPLPAQTDLSAAWSEQAGEQVQEGHVSLALRLSLADPGRTLTDGEIDAAVARVRDALAERGARLRG